MTIRWKRYGGSCRGLVLKGLKLAVWKNSKDKNDWSSLYQLYDNNMMSFPVYCDIISCTGPVHSGCGDL